MTSPITGMAFVRMSVPDLDRMQSFLKDFGLEIVHRDERRLYSRGVGPAPYLHVAELGPPGVSALAYEAESEAVLQRFVDSGDAPAIEPLDGPGGGSRVRLQAPGGIRVEIVWREAVQPRSTRPVVRGPEGDSRSHGAARIVRLAHCAYMTTTLPETLAWFQDKLGVIPTDELYVGSPENVIGQFDRLDRGDELVDHHVVFVLRGPRNGMHHASFQVEAVDDIFFGGDHLHGREHDHVRGIGRHALGSQIFDYWMSPFEQMHEHWISGERMNARSAFNRIQIGEGMSHDSGEKPPERFVKQASAVVPALADGA